MIKVPMAAVATIKDGKQYISILRNKKWELVEPPFSPFIYCREQLRLTVKEERLEKRLLSDLKPTTVWKYSFETTKDVEKVNAKYGKGNNKLFENHCPFVERVAIDSPDFYRQYPHIGPINVLFVDVEEITDNGKKTGVYIVGCKLNGEIKQLTGTVEEIIIKFMEIIKDVDIITGFNVVNYDMNVIKTIANAAKTKLDLSGIIIYDVAESVFSDQILGTAGLKDKKMKTIAKWYGWDAIELNGRNLKQYSMEEVLKYNESDLNVLEKLFHQYFGRYVVEAEKLGLPLRMIIDGYATTTASIVTARGLQRKGIVSDGSNAERHPEIKKKIQGAVVFLGQTGFVKKVVKCDFRQLYPSIILACNLGPDTTKILGYEEYNENKFNIDKLPSEKIYRIPDDQIGKTVVVHVDETEEGIVCKHLRELGEWREDIKKKMKEAKTESEKNQLNSQQNVIKIERNILYGYFTAKFSPYSDISAGIVITGIGRQLITRVMQGIKDKFGDVVVETDTDGCYINAEKIDNIDDFKKLVDTTVDDWCDENLGKRGGFVVEYEDYPAGWFAKMKNYILMKDNGALVIKGAGLKGSHKPVIFDKVLLDCATKLLAGEKVSIDVQEVIDKSPFEEFLMRVTIGKSINEYENDAVPKQLSEQLMRLKQPVQIGMIVEYAKIKNAYRAYIPETDEEVRKGLDKKYYKNMITKLVNALGINDVTTKSLFSFKDLPPIANSEILEKPKIDIKTNTSITENCPICKGTGNYLPAGKLVEEKCNRCKGTGKVEWEAF